MKSDNSEQKKLIVRAFNKADINITHPVLDFIIQLKNPLKKVGLIIKQTSFLPSVKGFLTMELLNEISDKEIQKALKRQNIKEDLSKAEEITPKKETDIKEKVEEKINPVKNLNDLPKIEASVKPIEFKTKVPQKSKSEKPVKKQKIKIKPTESAKSAFVFKPTAKEYNTQYKILKDPTGKIFTNGDYNDFYDLTIDKFNRLLKLMKNREEARYSYNISNISRLSQKNEISIVGLVSEIRQTKKGNYFLTLEDLTGTINVILRKDSENYDVKEIERIIYDQMILVKGVYNPPEKGTKGKGIIFGSEFSKIDIRTDFEPNKSPDPVSIALISDTHIGSKEFEEPLWNKFIDFLNGKIGNKDLREVAGRIKYIIINGDLVDGVGVYPSQQADLVISDIYKQFQKASELLSRIPDYIKIIFSTGNHDPVRNALPRPAVPKKYIEGLLDIGVKCVGNPSLIQTHGVNTLAYHGDSMLDLNMLIPGLEHDKPTDTMIELLKCRHLAPIYGKKTQIAPTNRDWMVVEKIPDIFHTGHIHINGMGHYRGVKLINSGCFQSQTDFMNSFGIHPTPGIVPIIELDTLNSREIDLKQ